MIERAEGTELIDSDGRRYIDGVSSLWCNVHGHRHPGIDAALREQLDRVAHSTMLGLSHSGAAELAAKLVEIAPPGLTRVFYSEAGATAVEIALKMAFQFQQQRGGQHRRRTSFAHMREAYHGDTIGSVSVGGIDLFHSTYRPLLFPTHPVEPGDAADLERVLSCHEEEIAALIVEPLVQGAAGMLVHPPGFLRRSARALRPLRRAADLRRGGDRLRPHRDDVRLRAGGRRAGPDVPRQGPHRRLPAAGGDAGHGADLRGLPRRSRTSSAPSSTATPTPATRSPAPPRSPASRPSRPSARWSAWRRRSSCSASCSSRSPRCPRSPRCAAAAR